MLSMICSELYRIVRSRFFVFYVVLVCLVSMVAPFALWLYRVWPAFAATGFVDMPAEPLPSLQLYGMMSVSGAFIAMGAGIAMALFVSEGFKSGFVKNLVQVRGGRLSYVVAVVVCAVFLVALRDCLDGYLAVDLAMLGQGQVCDPMIYVQAEVTILVVGGLAGLSGGGAFCHECTFCKLWQKITVGADIFAAKRADR